MKKKLLGLFLMFAIMSSIFPISNLVYAQNDAMIAAYKSVLWDHGTTDSYALYDIDKDNSPELLVQSEYGFQLYVYTFKNGTVIYLPGSVDAYGDEYYYEYPYGNGFLAHGGGMGTYHLEYVVRYEVQNDQIVGTDTITDSASHTFAQMQDTLAQYQKIVFKDATDLSLFDQLSGVKVVLNGENLAFDQPPVIINDRTMVPMRKIFETLGADVEWDASTQTVTATKGNIVVTVTIGSDYLSVTDNNYSSMISLDSPAVLVNNRTLVPVRAVSEAFDATVSWDANERTVYITTTDANNW
ncbi:MAG: copper amine oxidase N-terminal domain-containing protein [Ruminococcaceae bacterium]|nr:copper amine oxidase N-terminal domain-containing protein [Oscillospiraceae bacterium]